MDRNKARTYLEQVSAGCKKQLGLIAREQQKASLEWRCVATNSGSYTQEVADSYTTQGSPAYPQNNNIN